VLLAISGGLDISATVTLLTAVVGNLLGRCLLLVEPGLLDMSSTLTSLTTATGRGAERVVLFAGSASATVRPPVRAVSADALSLSSGLECGDLSILSCAVGIALSAGTFTSPDAGAGSCRGDTVPPGVPTVLVPCVFDNS
jgi:hypothetical protein